MQTAVDKKPRQEVAASGKRRYSAILPPFSGKIIILPLNIWQSVQNLTLNHPAPAFAVQVNFYPLCAPNRAGFRRTNPPPGVGSGTGLIHLDDRFCGRLHKLLAVCCD